MTPATDRPAFATGFAREEEHLALGEALWDPGTRERLAATGVGPGWSCLEIGAGRGSVAVWLAERVGPTGEVIAADPDTARLKWLTGRGVTVHRHDVVTDELPEARFDLIHARLVLQRASDRQQAVDRLHRALKPGGHLVLEDTDTASLFSHPAHDDFLGDVKRAAYDVLCASGHHPRCGLLDVQLATDAGLVDIVAEGRSAVVRGGTDPARWFALWLEHLTPAMLARGAVTEERLARAQLELTDPAHCWLSQVMVTVHGRRPASDPHGKGRTAP